jgi:hypothetical protein
MPETAVDLGLGKTGETLWMLFTLQLVMRQSHLNILATSLRAEATQQHGFERAFPLNDDSP